MYKDIVIHFKELFMWSLNGSSISFPNDSALVVGGISPIQLIVLQVHYIENTRIPRSGDTSGVLVHYHEGDTPPEYQVGIFSLHNHGVASANGLSFWDSACQLPIPNDNYPLIPFAFLAHTHGLGIHGSGWIVRNDSWTLIGEANPQVIEKWILNVSTVKPELEAAL